MFLKELDVPSEKGDNLIKDLFMNKWVQSKFFFFIYILDEANEDYDKLTRLGIFDVVQDTMLVILLTWLTIGVLQISRDYEHHNPNKCEGEIWNFKGRGLLNNFTFSGWEFL